MTLLDGLSLSRRRVLQGGGALIVSFTAFAAAAQQSQPQPEAQTNEPAGKEKLPGALGDTPMLDSWIRIDAAGKVTVFTGKAELGQGIKTAILQVAAEELAVEPGEIELITADTGRTPDERYTAGSQSMSESATAVRNAAAQVRAILIRTAAEKLGAEAAGLRAEDGAVLGPDGKRLGYGEIVSGRLLHVRAEPKSPLTPPDRLRVIGQSLPRVDIPAKVTGAPAYVQDLRLPGMVHARLVRPPSFGAQLRALDTAAVERMPGVLRVVRDGSFVAVIAEKEYQAVVAMGSLARAADWNLPQVLPKSADEMFALLRELPSDDTVIHETGAPGTPGAHKVEATFRRQPQMHGAIGPSCAVALFENDALTVWTHSQGVYPLRKAMAEMLRMPEERIRCIHVEGSGCYGHNGADDVAADAAVIARAYPGRPVRLQWMREHEHAWEPYGSPMVSTARAAVDDSGRIVDWAYEVWSHPHSTRPGSAGNLAASWLLADGFSMPAPRELKQPSGGGDRNAIPYYALPNARVVKHFVPRMPLRVSALRALGAYMNVFAIESMMDELAGAAKTDPVEFRLQHLEDERAIEVVKAAADRFGWFKQTARTPGRGRGFGFGRYKNFAAYCAVAIEVEVERERGRVRPVRAVAAVDSGEPVNPDGMRNQIEGGIIQAISWTLYEAVRCDGTAITTLDWGSYPILRFDAVPESLETVVMARPAAPFLGTGEASQGPAAAALANAITDATGLRFRELPITAAQIRAATGV